MTLPLPDLLVLLIVSWLAGAVAYAIALSLKIHNDASVREGCILHILLIAVVLLILLKP